MKKLQKIIPISAEVRLSETINIPGSKSITNRAFLLSALSVLDAKDGEYAYLNGVLDSNDTRAFYNCIQSLGFEILEVSQNKYKISAISKDNLLKSWQSNPPKIYCHDAGTAVRFLIPMIAALGGFGVEVSASEQMTRRPIQALIEALEQQGSKFRYTYTPGALPLIIEKNKDNLGLSGGKLLVDTKDSSQFISGLLMVAPFANSPMEISLTQTRRQSYIDMTIKMMQDFGVGVQRLDKDSYFISNNKKYTPIEYNIEPDASTASYFFALAALSGGEISVPNLDYKNSLQGDVKFLDVLEKMGCKISYVKEQNIGYTKVKGPKILKGFGLDNPIDVSAFSDTFMTLAAIAPFADKPVHIKGISHTRKQESDRVHAIAVGLESLGVKVEEQVDDLIIYPTDKDQLHGAVVSSFHDHRIAMSLALVGLMVPGVVIEDADAVCKTCPDYFEMLKQVCSGNN